MLDRKENKLVYFISVNVRFIFAFLGENSELLIFPGSLIWLNFFLEGDFAISIYKTNKKTASFQSNTPNCA